MSHIPQARTGLKPPSKVHKPIQGGGGSTATSPTSSSSGIVRPRGNPAQRPLSTPGAVRTMPSAGKSSAGSGVVRPRGSAGSNVGGGIVSPRGSSHATSAQQLQPRLSRENSETRLAYRREGSSSSLRSSSSESSESAVRRRSSSSSQQGATSAADLKKFFEIGDRVLVSGTKPGVIGFIGETKFAKGDWAGVILDEPTGKNDGSVAGVRYFECKPLHGVFTKLEKITKINKVNVTHLNDGSTTALETGDRVVVSGTKIGTVRYVGTTGFAKGEWAGVELDEPLGKNDGAVAGTRYFQCQQDFGLFAPVHKVVKTGKKESTKLPSSPPPTQKEQPLSIPPQLQESVLNSVTETLQSQAKADKTVVSPESTLSAVAQKTEVEGQDQPDISAGKTPTHVSLQLVALQEALQDRERQIQALLEERDFERNEVASATSQVAKAEEELLNVKKKHEEVAHDNAKSIQELKNLVDLGEKEKADLYLQLEEEKRKNEDLQFKLEEEEIILGDELKTEEEQIKGLTQDLQKNQDELKKITDELEKTKVEKSGTATMLQEKEHELLESNQQLSVLKISFEESRMKINELEGKISSMEEKHSALSSEASQGMKEQLEKINMLEKELSLRSEKEKQNQTIIENTKYELKIAQEENDSLRTQIEDLTAKLISKENEFDSMSDELRQIKSATLELQKQLQISEAKTMNLSSDKNKLESEIAELMKNSGSNSERLTYLNEQLREKDRMMDELKGASAEAQIQIGRLTEDVAQAKESHSKDLEKLGKSNDEQMKKFINQINSLKTDLEKQRDENTKLVQAHKHELEEKCSQYDAEIQAKQKELSQLTSKLDAAMSEKSLLTSAQGDTEKKISEVMEKYEKLNSDYQTVLQEKNDKTKMCQENENQVKTLNQEKETILQEKRNTQNKLDELQAQYSALMEEMEVLKSHSTQKEEELTLLKSSASDKASESTELQSQLEQVKTERDQFKRKIVVLEEQSSLLQEQVNCLGSEKSALESQTNEMVAALAKAQDEIITLNARAQERPTSLASEIPSLDMENDLEAMKHELKLKDEQLAKYKQQVLDVKKQMATTMTANNSGGVNQDNADLAVKLVETEDLLEATAAEKENLDAQVEFLNSVIVDLQRKNEENEQRIELLMMGDTRANGLLDSPELDEAPIPRYKVRLFCDICDVFDEHDTDDCPAQASEAPDVGSMHHGSRTESRPYCTTCEVFGHWTKDCDDEETF